MCTCTAVPAGTPLDQEATWSGGIDVKSYIHTYIHVNSNSTFSAIHLIYRIPFKNSSSWSFWILAILWRSRKYRTYCRKWCWFMNLAWMLMASRDEWEIQSDHRPILCIILGRQQSQKVNQGNSRRQKIPRFQKKTFSRAPYWRESHDIWIDIVMFGWKGRMDRPFSRPGLVKPCELGTCMSWQSCGETETLYGR